MKYLAILKDSLRETLDRKSFFVLQALSAVFILVCASISFRPLDEREAVQSVVDGFTSVRGPSLAQDVREYPRARFTVGPVEKREEGGRARYRFRLEAAPPEEVHRLVRHWTAVREKRMGKPGEPAPDAGEPTDLETQRRFLRERFGEGLLGGAEIQAAGEMAWDVKILLPGRRALAGAEEMALFFGAFRWRPRYVDLRTGMERYMSSAEAVNVIQTLVSESLAGWIGMLAALVATAGFVPGMLQKGTLDLVLSKPVRRSTLLVYKYLGGCAFVLLSAALAVGGSWMALSLRTGHWNVWFPLTILTLTFFFAVLYSISVLMGVLARSSGVACFVTLAAWGLCSAVGTFVERALPVWNDAPRAVQAAARFVYLLLPKTADLGRLNAEICAKGNLGEAASRILPSFAPPLRVEFVLGTSALFALLMLSLACLRFSSRDY